METDGQGKWFSSSRQETSGKESTGGTFYDIKCNMLIERVVENVSDELHIEQIINRTTKTMRNIKINKNQRK